MKKIICFIMTAVLLLSSSTVAFAKPKQTENTYNQKVTKQQNQRLKAKKQSFKINKSPVIKFGKYKLPISPVTKGMGATVKYDKNTAVLTVEKGTNTIVIDFKNKTVTVNGVADTKSGIFSSKNNNKMTVLIKYIAKVLGIRTNWDKDEVIVEVPGLDLPTNVGVTTFGTNVIVNTLNTSSLYLTATANIKAGQATGGKAELYIGSKLIATDPEILAADTTVTFTTSDNTPTNVELQAIIPTGGVVTVKLYNASNKSVTSTVANPTLAVDYAAPTITGVTSAVYSASGSAISLNVTGAGAVGDMVDVTKLILYDNNLGKAYQLTNTAETGSTGVVVSSDLITIKLGAADKLGLAGFGSTAMFLTISEGYLLKDAAGNVSPVIPTLQTVPVIIIQ